MRTANKAAIGQPLLNQGLRFLQRQSFHVDVVDERQIDVAGIADARLRGQFRHVVDAHFDQIAGPEFHHAAPHRLFFDGIAGPNRQSWPGLALAPEALAAACRRGTAGSEPVCSAVG